MLKFRHQRLKENPVMVFDIKKQISKYDRGNILGSIEMLANQMDWSWTATQQLDLPRNYKKCNKILVSGMGGSALGAQMVSSALSDRLAVPLFILNDYNLPAWVDKETLVIISSYSGNTEETISTLNQAVKVKCPVLGITTGGELAKICQKNSLPLFLINTQYNPSNQPRLALGYAFVGLIGILNQLGYIDITEAEIKQLIATVKKFTELYGVKNRAQNIVPLQELQNQQILLIGSEHLVGNLHVLANQINENAKTFATYFPIPELNHHLLEGLKLPTNFGKSTSVIFFNSNLYSQRNSLRYPITKEIFKKSKIKIYDVRIVSRTKLEQAGEMLVFGSYLSFYLAILNKLNPSLIPNVDLLKKKLGH